MLSNDNLCPRLIDYIAIVGVRNPHRNSRSSMPPELLRRYPPIDHDNGNLPLDVVHFCQPDGCINSPASRNANKETTDFVFTLTEKDTGKVRYGICLNFLRQIDRRSPTKASRSVQDRLGSASSAEMAISIDKKRPDKRNRPRTHSLTSLLIISHHPFFCGFVQCLEVLKDIIERFDERTKRRSNGRDSIWPTLLGVGTEPGNNVICHDVMEIETWIFRLLSAPVPVPGITKIELYLLPESIMPPLIFAIPDKERLQLVDFPLHTIFDLMGVEFALKLFIAVLLENKVIIQSKNIRNLSICILSLKVLLYPLEYMFPIVTLLPTSMLGSEQLFMVPSPFVIGIPASFLAQRKNFKLPSDIFLFDLDQKQVTLSTNSSVISKSDIDSVLSLPSDADFNLLVKHIKQALNSISDQTKPIKNFDEVMESLQKQLVSKPSQPESSSFNKLIFGNDCDSVDVSTRVAMIRFFNSPNILGDYSRYTRILKLYPRPVIAFQVDSFLLSRKEVSDFVKKLSKTTAIISFGEWSVVPKNFAYFKISSGMYDPRIIGDKPKWFHNGLEAFPFRVYRENGGCSLHLIFNQDSNIETDSPTDESGSDSDSTASISSSHDITSNFSDLADSGVSGISIRGSYKGTSKNFEELQRLTVDVQLVYHPPTYLQIPNANIVDKLKINLDDVSGHCIVSDSEEMFLKKKFKEQRKKSLCHDLSTDFRHLKDQPKNLDAPQLPQDTDSGVNMNSPHSVLSEPNSKIQLFDKEYSQSGQNQYDVLTEATRTFSRLIDSTFPQSRLSLTPDYKHQSLKPLSVRKSVVDRNEMITKIQETHNSSKRSSFSSVFFSDKKAIERENQVYLHKVSDEILNGIKPSFIQQFRLKSLFENEEYRNLVLSKLNKNLGKSQNTKEETFNDGFIRDILITSEDEFNAFVCICKLIISGIENSYEKGNRDGLGSVFVLLEMLHTHYIDLKDFSIVSMASSMNTSPTESDHRLPRFDSSPATIINSISMPVNVNGEEYENVEITSNKGKGFHNHVLSDTDINGYDSGSIFSPFSKNKSTPVDNFSRQTSSNRPTNLDIRSETSSIHSFCENRVRFIIDYNFQPKTSLSQGYRFRMHQLYYSKAPSLPDESGKPSSLSPSKPSPKGTSLFSRLLSPQGGSAKSVPISNGYKPEETSETHRIYLFQKLTDRRDRARIWNNLTFWEDVFYDAVCQERDIIGLDVEPIDLLERYNTLDIREKQRLERSEDKLLGIVINNIIAFMIMMRVNPIKIKEKASCMIGKSHVGLDESANINKLVDALSYLRGNDIDLRTNVSRLLELESFSVYCGTNKQGNLLIAEVYRDCLLLRTVSGKIVSRWWFERIINCTCKKNIICISVREDSQILLTHLYCKKSKELIDSILRKWEKFKVDPDVNASDFNATDVVTKCSGRLKVDNSGIKFRSDSEEWFVDLMYVKRCLTRKPDKFIVEILDPNTKVVTYRIFRSSDFDKIAYCVLNQFSLLAANLSKDNVKISSNERNRL